MEQVVFKTQNSPEHLRLLAEIPMVDGHPTIFDLVEKAYAEDPLPGKIVNAIQTGGSHKEITISECMEQDLRVQYQGKRYV